MSDPFVQLSEVAEIVSGTSPSGKEINANGNGVPFFQGSKEFGFRHPTVERFTTSPIKMARAGDILLSVRAPLGRVNIASDDCAIGRGVMAVRAKNASDGPYIAAFLRAMEEAWDAHSTDGTMFANLSKTGLENLPIRWPENRKPIAEVLDAVDDAILNSRSLVISLEESIELEGSVALMESESSTFYLPELASVTNGYSYSSAELVDESDQALVNLKNFGRHGGFRVDGLKPFDGAPKNHQMLASGDLMIAKTDLTQDAEVIGRCLRMPKLPQYASYVASLDIAIVRSNGSIPQGALHSILAQSDFREHCLGYTNGTTVLHMSKGALETYRIPDLSLETSARLASRVDVHVSQQDRMLIELHHLQVLRDFLLPRLVSGELRMTEIDEIAGSIL